MAFDYTAIINILTGSVLDTEITVPYTFVGYDAFPLKVNIMRPFPGNNPLTEENGLEKQIYIIDYPEPSVPLRSEAIK